MRGGRTFRRLSLAVWMSSSLGFSLKVPWAHSSATYSKWQEPRVRPAGIGGQESPALFPFSSPTIPISELSPGNAPVQPSSLREHFRPSAPLLMGHGPWAMGVLKDEVRQ